MAGWCQQTFCFQKFVDNAQQCFAFTPQTNFSAHNLNFHKRWRWWDQIQATFQNRLYLKSHIYYSLVDRRGLDGCSLVMLSLQSLSLNWIFKYVYHWNSHMEFYKKCYLCCLTILCTFRPWLYSYWCTALNNKNYKM